MVLHKGREKRTTSGKRTGWTWGFPFVTCTILELQLLLLDTWGQQIKTVLLLFGSIFLTLILNPNISSVSRIQKVFRRKINVCMYIFNCQLQRGFTQSIQELHLFVLLLICPNWPNEIGPWHLYHITMTAMTERTKETNWSVSTNPEIIIFFFNRTNPVFCYVG